MCALFGYLDCGKTIPHKTLQKLLQALANASEERGDHASGIAYNCSGKLTIYKRPHMGDRVKYSFIPVHFCKVNRYFLLCKWVLSKYIRFLRTALLRSAFDHFRQMCS